MADESDWFSDNAPKQEEQDWFATNAPKPVAQESGGIGGFARGVGGAVVEAVQGLLPTSTEKVAELATPLVGGVKHIVETGQKLSHIAFGGKTFAEEFPQGKTYPEFTATDWGKWAGGIGVNTAMAALIHKGITKEPTLSEQAFGKSPEAAPVEAETAATEPVAAEPIAQPIRKFSDLNDEQLVEQYHGYRADYANRPTEQLSQVIDEIGEELGRRSGLSEGTVVGQRGGMPVQETVTPTTATPLPQETFPSILRSAEEQRRIEQNASEITSTEGVTQPEVRARVGEEAPLRQQGEPTEARQEVVPTEEVAQPAAAPEVAARPSSIHVESGILNPADVNTFDIAHSVAKEIGEQFPQLKDITVQPKKRPFGMATEGLYHRKENAISLSFRFKEEGGKKAGAEWFNKPISEERVKDTLVHELAHGIAGRTEGKLNREAMATLRPIVDELWAKHKASQPTAPVPVAEAATTAAPLPKEAGVSGVQEPVAEIPPTGTGGVAVPPTEPPIVTPETPIADQPKTVPTPAETHAASNGENPIGIAERYREEQQPGSVIPGVGRTADEARAWGHDFINKGGNPYDVVANKGTKRELWQDVGVVRAEYERLSNEKRAAESALEANPNDPQAQMAFENADLAQRQWSKDAQPVLTRAGDALRAASRSYPREINSFSDFTDIVNDHFKGEVELTPEKRAELQKAVKAIKKGNVEATEARAQVTNEAVKKAGGKVMSFDDLKTSLTNKMTKLMEDCAT